MIQLPLFETAESNWRPPSLDSLPKWTTGRVGIDLETRDPELKTLGTGGGRRKNNYITGISFAIEDGPGAYLPIRHDGGDNLPVENVLRYLRDQAQNFSGDIAGANLSYDLDFLAGEGIHFKNVRYFRDIQVAEPLIDELQMSYSMESIAGRHGILGKDEGILRAAAADYKINPKSDMWVLPARYVGPYAEQDARLPLQILRRQERIIDEQDLWRVYDMESKLLPVLVKVRRRGVKIDLDHLERIERWSLEQERIALAEVNRLIGVKVNIGDVWRAAALVPVLEYFGVVIKKTPKSGKAQVDKEAFRAIDHPAARAIERARKVNKLRTTFAQSIRDHIVGDRIHCTFNQLKRAKEGDTDNEETSGAAYGRLSCEHPNLQQQPSRDEFAKMWRAIYLPDEGQLWAACDYSQQEPRMAVHYASISEQAIGRAAWLKACEARDKYRTDPETDNHQMMADMAGIDRKPAKDIYLGLTYNMMGPKLCRSLGLPTIKAVRDPDRRWGVVDITTKRGQQLMAMGHRVFEAAGPEGQALLDLFDQKVPFLKKLSQAAEKVAKGRGYIITLGGRRCRFPKDEHGNYEFCHKALNRLIQGSSADQTKEAMIAVDAAGYDIIIQVHDEIANGVSGPGEAEEIAEIMRNCMPLELPSKVDVEIGKSWGHSMGYKDEE